MSETEKTPDCKVTPCQGRSAREAAKEWAEHGGRPDELPSTPSIALHRLFPKEGTKRWVVFYSVRCPDCYVNEVTKVVILAEEDPPRLRVLDQLAIVHEGMSMNVDEHSCEYKDLDNDGRKEIPIDFEESTNNWCNDMLDRQNIIIVANVSKYIKLLR